jgi:hypothetical protein
MITQIPEEWSESRIGEWLLILTSSGRSELLLPSDIPVSAGVKKLFERATPEMRERLKRGVVMAVQEWQYGAHRYRALQELSEIAALVRATGVIPRLAELVKRECEQNRDDSDRAATLITATACLRGFAPAADLDLWLRMLFYDRHIEPRLGGLLFVGLLKGRPDTLHLHAARFLELRRSVASGFAHLGAALIDAVPPVCLITQFGMLSADARREVSDIIESAHHPELEFRLGDSGVVLFWTSEPSVKVAADDRVTTFAHLYEKELRSLSIDNPSSELLSYIH